MGAYQLEKKINTWDKILSLNSQSGIYEYGIKSIATE